LEGRQFCGPLDFASVRGKLHVNPSNGLHSTHECDRQTDNIPHYREVVSCRRNRVSYIAVSPQN